METNILVVGRDRAILEVIERLINVHEGWRASIAETADAALEVFRKRQFAIVFVSAGFEAEEEEQLRQILTKMDPRVTVTRHYGGGSGLLENEILGILNKDKQ